MWNSKVKIKHLLTEGEGHEEVQRNMNAIADVLEKESAFMAFNRSILAKFRNIPPGDDIIGPVDYANKLLDAVYDYADDYRIWID